MNIQYINTNDLTQLNNQEYLGNNNYNNIIISFFIIIVFAIIFKKVKNKINENKKILLQKKINEQILFEKQLADINFRNKLLETMRKLSNPINNRKKILFIDFNSNNFQKQLQEIFKPIYIFIDIHNALCDIIKNKNIDLQDTNLIKNKIIKGCSNIHHQLTIEEQEILQQIINSGNIKNIIESLIKKVEKFNYQLNNIIYQEIENLKKNNLDNDTNNKIRCYKTYIEQQGNA